VETKNTNGFFGPCANGARGLYFFAAKRSGASSQNMAAGMRARLSRLGGFKFHEAALQVIVSPAGAWP
jgi:hypothetical protein